MNVRMTHYRLLLFRFKCVMLCQIQGYAQVQTEQFSILICPDPTKGQQSMHKLVFYQSIIIICGYIFVSTSN
jgi:hypothetical protein